MFDDDDNERSEIKERGDYIVFEREGERLTSTGEGGIRSSSRRTTGTGDPRRSPALESPGNEEKRTLTCDANGQSILLEK